MMKYLTWVNRHCSSLEGKKILFVGGTGTIGYYALTYLLYLKAKITLAARNLEKAEKIKAKLLAEFPGSEIRLIMLDVSSLRDIDRMEAELKEEQFDCIFNNAGVYHLPSSKTEEGYEIHFATNALGSGYFCEKMIPHLKENGRLILTDSISAYFAKLSLSDIQNQKVKSKLKLYSLTKRTMLYNSLYIKNHLLRENQKLEIYHPGVVATELMEKGYSKTFMKTVFPLLKLLTHSPQKASLGLVWAAFEDTPNDEWICPRGLFQVWGYPTKRKLRKEFLDKNKQEKIHFILAEYSNQSNLK